MVCGLVFGVCGFGGGEWGSGFGIWGLEFGFLIFGVRVSGFGIQMLCVGFPGRLPIALLPCIMYDCLGVGFQGSGIRDLFRVPGPRF